MRKGVISVLSALAGAAIGAGVARKGKGEALKNANYYAQKHFDMFLMMNQWIKVKQEGKNLSSYFESNGYKKIAVYGMGYAGETLVDELKETNTQIAYGIDQKEDTILADITVVSPEDMLEDVDVVVVTAIAYFDEIEEKMSSKVNCPILSLDDILYGM